MDLRTYADSLPRGGLAAFAAVLGITPIYLSQLIAKQDGRVPSPTLCVQIEKATGGKVMRWDLRPDDWRRIWPELIGAQGAPLALAPEEQPDAKPPTAALKPTERPFVERDGDRRQHVSILAFEPDLRVGPRRKADIEG